MTAPATERITRGGQTLSARMWSMLEDSYRAAGLDPDTFLVVTQGAYKGGHGAAASGSTHDGAGAADLRTWNLPSSVQRSLCDSLVVELRRRGGCAWFRDEAHGGFSPHVHVILRDEPGLSSGAAWQVGEYDAARNGLSNGGPDYHPRPTQTPYVYPPTPATPTITEDTVPTLYKLGASRYRAVFGDRYIGIPQSLADKLSKAHGIPIVGITEDEDRALSSLSPEV